MSDDQQQNSGHNAIQVKGDRNILLLQMAPTLASLAESQTQANFYRATGIHCSKRARIRLEDLLESHGFTVRELRRVWNSGAMTLSRKENFFEFHSRWIDLTVGWLGVFLLSVVFLVYGTSYIDRISQAPIAQSVAFAAGILVYVLGLLIFSHGFLWPQRIATRVRLATSKAATSEKMEGQALPTAA